MEGFFSGSVFRLPYYDNVEEVFIYLLVFVLTFA